MFVKCSQEIPADLDTVREVILPTFAYWCQPLAEEARARSQELQSEVGLVLPCNGVDLRVEIGEPMLEERLISVPFRVRVEGAQEQWPSFDGLLVSAWFGRERTQLELAGQYDPPAGMSREMVSLLHRVVDAVSREFLTAVAARLGEGPGLSVVAD
jgi:hypothetical protein